MTTGKHYGGMWTYYSITTEALSCDDTVLSLRYYGGAKREDYSIGQRMLAAVTQSNYRSVNEGSSHYPAEVVITIHCGVYA